MSVPLMLVRHGALEFHATPPTPPDELPCGVPTAREQVERGG
ncbi:MAG: hypothetical protein WB565_18270 [Acidimicrobiales bacterium]